MIVRFSVLKGLGVFSNYSATADVPELRRHNLIYGFNGSGKTTLSRVLASLGAGYLRPQLPPGGTFAVELAGGAIVKSEGSLDALKGRLLVFNVDFIEDNLKWKDGTANPVFYIGKEQAGLAEKLGKVETEFVALASKQTECQRALDKANKAFVDFKRSAARTIAEQLGTRNYEAPALVADYGTRTYGVEDELAQEAVQPLLAAIAQQAPMQKLGLLDSQSIGITGLASTTRRLLSTTLGELAVAELRQHGPMVRWVKQGVEYHAEHKLASCLFCGNELTAMRMDALKAALDDRFDRLTAELAEKKSGAVHMRDRIAALNVLPSVNDIAMEFRAEFAPLVGQLSIKLGEARATVAKIVEDLESKIASPNTKVDDSGLVTDAAATGLEADVVSIISRINTIIRRHNEGVDRFDEGKETGRTKIKAHHLARNQASFRKLGDLARDAKTALEQAIMRKTELAREAEDLRRDVRTHGQAAGIINALVHGYLGHKELEVRTLESGYQILRSGTPVTASLSEGEKTAIALCYFLSTLEAEGRRRKDLIVVVDDPISSLDTRALSHAFGLIKSALGGAGQLIVMTHNLHFMNAMKKWLRNAARSKTPTATLLFLDARQDAQSGLRSVAITELPHLIREYESEYHYLFHLVLRFVDGRDDGYLYLMPNALRKVLEIFLAFKLPNSSGLASKVEQITVSFKLDQARMVALDRLVQLESHADSLDDIVTFSSMTIEETKQAAAALVEMMHAVDAPHLEQLSRLCRAVGA